MFNEMVHHAKELSDQYVDSCENDRKVIAVGWSLGGHVAIEMLLRSERVQGLVITGTPPADSPDEIDTAFTFGPGGWRSAVAGRKRAACT
jgi:pimeloyl-ACP methyl ester carboxylesterase